MEKIKGVSLFSNVGIAETYINNTIVDIVVANELLEKRAMFYKESYPETNMIVGDITNSNIYNQVLNESKKNKCNFLIATPPCQGMSVAGKMKQDDPRNYLIKFVVKFIKDLQPNNILIENVVGILKTFIFTNNKYIRIVDYLTENLTKYGYIINYDIIDCADYGTPQTRKRAIFLISKVKKWEFPKKEKKYTVRDTIGSLPTLESGEVSSIKYHYAKKHNNRHILCMKHTPTGKTALENQVYYPKKENGTKVKGYATTYKRMEWDKPAPTITMANGSISSQNNVHPGRLKKDGIYSNARVLTLKEIFILTGLPDNWNPPFYLSFSKLNSSKITMSICNIRIHIWNYSINNRNISVY
jgi:DNA (cytosine-5)-methyltransferase 1